MHLWRSMKSRRGTACPYNNADLSIACDSIRNMPTAAALYAIARPSVCPSVCPSVTRVNQSKTVEVKIMQLVPQSIIAPWLTVIVSSWLTSPRNSEWERGIGKIRNFLPINKSPYLRKVQDMAKVSLICDGVIGIRICTFDRHRGRWPWMT